MKRAKLFLDCYHPLLFSLAPILFLYSQNIDQGPFIRIISPALIAIGFTALFMLLLNLVVRNKWKSSLIVSIFIIIFFSYGHAYNLIQNFGFQLLGINIGPNKIITALTLIIFFLLSFLTLKTCRRLDRFTKLLNGVAVISVLLPLINIAVYQFGRGGSIEEISSEDHLVVRDAGSGKVAGRPDIYYIILDAYGRADTLKELYDHDNSEFLDYLRDKGFFIAEESMANYSFTAPSIASTLQMSYLDSLLGSGQTAQVRELWNNSPVVEFLKSQGYTYVFLPTASAFWYVKDMDVRLESKFPISDFLSELINTTPLTYMLPVIYSRYQQHRTSILYAFNALRDLSYLGSPKFVYAHFGVPHQPFVFDEDGSPIESDRPYTVSNFLTPQQGGIAGRGEYLEGYRKQIVFTNNKVKELVDGLLALPGAPPVIILQGDHGPAGYLDTYNNIGNSHLKERMTNLNAYYLPGAENQLYEGITPVNTFRLIFNQYFGTEYELLPDRSYIFNEDHPYVFIDVTDRISGR